MVLIQLTEWRSIKSAPGPGGKVGPFFLNPGNPGLHPTLISFLLPASGLNAAAVGPGLFVISNMVAPPATSSSKKSNAVSVPIGQAISVVSVAQSGALITVNGSGFQTLTVMNLFNLQGTVSVNLGGLNPNGTPKIPLTLVSPNRFTFTPSGDRGTRTSLICPDRNPPFVPFTSSGNAPGGAFTIK